MTQRDGTAGQFWQSRKRTEEGTYLLLEKLGCRQWQDRRTWKEPISLNIIRCTCLRPDKGRYVPRYTAKISKPAREAPCLSPRPCGSQNEVGSSFGIGSFDLPSVPLSFPVLVPFKLQFPLPFRVMLPNQSPAPAVGVFAPASALNSTTTTTAPPPPPRPVSTSQPHQASVPAPLSMPPR